MTNRQTRVPLFVACFVSLLFVALQPAAAGATYAAEQAERGATLYSKHCASCHGDRLEGGAGRPLTGPAFTQTWGQATRSADDLYYVMHSSMPLPAAGSLTEREYVDLLAFILSRNGVPAGTDALSANPATLTALRMTTTSAGDGGQAAAKKQFIVGEAGMTPVGKGPSAADLRAAGSSTDWLYHTHDFRGTRYSPLGQIDRGNVRRLQVACIYQLGSTEPFVTGPIVYRGTMYVTTARLTAAIDAATCRERWHYKWQPQDTELWPNNRGVAIEDGYVVRGTADGYLVALDAADGRLLWARQVAHPAAGETITMPPLIYQDLVIIGPAGSELNVQGWIGAFKLADGSPVWRFNTIPKAGEPGFETWPRNAALPVGGGSVWSPMSLDADRGMLYVPVTNPSPDYPAHLRPGANLYTNSLVALDVTSGKLKWYAQLIANDDKDWDVTQVSPILETQVAGKTRNVIVAGGKDGIVRVLDRDTHKVLHETAIGTRVNTDKPITREGTRYCPGVFGGIQWNGPAWNPQTNALYVPTVDWCTTGKLEDNPRLIPGQLYMGGTNEQDSTSQGFLTAIDVASGAIRWQYRSGKPMLAGVTTTAGGLAFAGELTGDLIALDVENGSVLYRFNTGGAMSAGVVTYAVDGRQYVGAASGHGSITMGDARGSPTIVVFTLPALKD
jgi:alcohol dehydrogenase (cytochrome c)